MTNPSKAIRQSIAERKEELTRLKAAMAKVAEGIKIDQKALEFYKDSKESQKTRTYNKTKQKNGKLYLWQKLEACLTEAEAPMVATDLLKAVTGKYPESIPKPEQWTSLLYTAVKTKQEMFKVIKTGDKRFFGLSQWVNGNGHTWKPEFKDKIAEP